MVPADALSVPGGIVPMPGRWDASGADLLFRPRLPFARGVVHVLLRRTADARGWLELARLQRPAAVSQPSAVVTAIRPDVDEVPENLLRCSVAFSNEMEEGSAAGRVRLEDAAGDELLHTLFPMPPELWDRQRRRLTLLLEPGRIKRGLVPNRALGAPLSGLREFHVVVDATIRDVDGAMLAAGARRGYRVGPPVRSRVDPARWSVGWPPAGTRDVLAVVFERPLDHALALRCLVVRDEQGRPLPGSAALDPGAVRWTFRPAAPWPDVGVRLHVDPALEDLAGNSVRRVFDRDLEDPDDDPADEAEVVLSSIRAVRGAAARRRRFIR